MVNYLYRLADVETNHEAYTGEGRVTVSTGVKTLARLKETSRSR
jgi:malonyl-CoA decarboxylase